MTTYELHTLRVAGNALRDNPLGDPWERDLPVLAPAGVEPDRPLPLVFVLSGFSGAGYMLLNHDPWSEGMRQRLDRLAAAGRLGPMLVALPDCFTKMGGSQYINSPATGRYEDHLWHDLLPAVRSRFSVGRVGVAGKSSGGFGAMVQAMRHPEIVSACASHSGDLYFDYSYLNDFTKVRHSLLQRGGVAGFLAHFAAAEKKRDGRLIDAMNILCMAACYSPDPSQPGGFALPFDVETGEVDRAVWARWLAWDPIRMIEHPAHVEALRALRLLHIECGSRDEYGLDVGARIFSRRLRALSVPHTHEEFDDTHMGINYRYDRTLPALYAALS